jgi:hypothetical protein
MWATQTYTYHLGMVYKLNHQRNGNGLGMVYSLYHRPPINMMMTWGWLIIGLPHYNGNITGMLGLQTKVHITIGCGS